MELKIDRYEVQRLIGQGAMGKIYLASDPKLGREVAIKMLSSQRADAQVVDRFRLEARAIATLKHPNIVELYDYSGENAADLFLVMEYVPGRTLHDMVLERGPMPEVTALCVTHELLLALDHAHRHGVIHRDLKPENVLLFEGRIVLTDFGIVKQIAATSGLGRQLRTATEAIGTPGFMAPEQFTAGAVDARTDIFALGAVLYNLTTGHLPFPGDNIGEVAEMVRKGTFKDPRTFSPILSDGLLRILTRSLKVKPKDRFRSVDEMKAEVIEVLRGSGVTELRREILDYEANPASHAIQVREREQEVLLRELKIAVKDKNEQRVHEVVSRMQTVAPLNTRARGVTGLRWSKGKLPRLSPDRRRGGRLLWLTVGLLLGAALGAAGALSLLVMGFISTEVMAWFERFADLVGYGY